MRGGRGGQNREPGEENVVRVRADREVRVGAGASVAPALSPAVGAGVGVRSSSLRLVVPWRVGCGEGRQALPARA